MALSYRGLHRYLHSMHALANPARFARNARALTGPIGIVGVALIVTGIVGGLFATPPDYLQGETVRILYVHVPAAWLGMAGWAGLAAAGITTLVWRHPLGAIAGRATAVPGAVFAAVCLATGSIWGRPTWGTWWEWDGRMTSMLILLFLYIGYIALSDADRSGGRMAAIFALVGAVNLPVIRYSVTWWNSLHQPQSITLKGSAIAPELLWPLVLTTLGFSCLFVCIVLMRMRALLAEAKAEARMLRRSRG